jgi:hypothetical protein
MGAGVKCTNWTRAEVEGTMGCMSASDAAPLPRLGEVYFDVRGDSRSMRLSWYADTGVAVFSIWQGGTCTGTFRLPIADLPRMVEALQRGPRGAADEPPPEPAGPRTAAFRPPGVEPSTGLTQAADHQVTDYHVTDYQAADYGDDPLATHPTPAGPYREDPAAGYDDPQLPVGPAAPDPLGVRGGRSRSRPRGEPYSQEEPTGDYGQELPGRPGGAAPAGYGGEPASGYPGGPPPGYGDNHPGRDLPPGPPGGGAPPHYADEPSGGFHAGPPGGFGDDSPAGYGADEHLGGGRHGGGTARYADEPPAGFPPEPPGYVGGPPPGYEETLPRRSRRGSPAAGYADEASGEFPPGPPGGYPGGPPPGYGDVPPGRPGGGPPPRPPRHGEVPSGYLDDPPRGFGPGDVPGEDYGESPVRPYVARPPRGQEEPEPGPPARGRRRGRGHAPDDPAPESFPYGPPPGDQSRPRGRYSDDR